MENEVFGKIAYDVMRCVFSIHKEFGRFFDEKIYKRELQRRYPNVQLEIPLEVRFENFSKTYFLDVLVGDGAAFEFKTVDALVGRHRSQLLHYLLMADLSHGKLVNLRPELVQHEFINAPMRLAARTQFSIQRDNWNEMGKPIGDWFIAFLRDIGAGLDIALYEEALTHLLGGEEHVLQEVEVISHGSKLWTQKFRLVAPDVALKITALGELEPFEIHAQRLLAHTSLRAIQWFNVTPQTVRLRTLRK
jgi:GxxExxY protein